MRSARFLVAAGMVSATLAGCGSSSAINGLNPKDVVKLSSQRVAQQSLRADLSGRFIVDASHLTGVTPAQLKQFLFPVPSVVGYGLPLGNLNLVGITLDVFNALNHSNLGNYNTDAPLIRDSSGNIVPNPAFGTARDVITDARRYQIGLEVNW